MKKAVKIGVSVIVASGIFAAGIFSTNTKAVTDWKTNTINNANSVLGESGYNEKEKLKSSAQNDINNVVQDKLNNEVDSQKTELQQLLDQYYQDKLNGLTDTPEFHQLEDQIKTIKANILKRYEGEIDQVFAGQQSN